MGITPAAQLVTRITRPSDLDDVFSVVRNDFAKVDALIPRQMTSDIALVSEIGRYIVGSGGKRLRSSYWSLEPVDIKEMHTFD